MVRIICIGDTHGLHYSMEHDVTNFIDKKQSNYLIHAGDCCNTGSVYDVRNFVYWFQNLKGFDDKIFIAGNHDWGFELKYPWLYHYINDENLSQSDCVYLEDNELTIKEPEFTKPIKIYGTPWQPPFNNWAFNVPEKKLYKYWEKIPIDTNILITHTPPFGILDEVYNREKLQHKGSKSLYEYVQKIKPQIHIFGHIHGGRALFEKDETIFINASVCTEEYEPINKPIVIDFDFNTNKWELINI